MIQLQRLRPTVTGWSVLLLILLTLLCNPTAVASCQSVEQTEESQGRLRRIFINFEDLNDWMKTQQAYLPMSYQRYVKLLAFANRNEGSSPAIPVQHFIRLSRGGQVTGRTLYRIPESKVSSEKRRVDLSNWKLSGSFFQAIAPDIEYKFDSIPAIPQLKLAPVSVGVDQDGQFGLVAGPDLKFLAVTYEVTMSTGRLFDGFRTLDLPVDANTQTIVEMPRGLNIEVSPEVIVRRIRSAPEIGDDGSTTLYTLTTFEKLLTLGFSADEPKQALNTQRIEYTENTKLSAAVGKQSYTSTIILEKATETDIAAVEVLVPPSVTSRNCFVNGKVGKAKLSFNSYGESSWIVNVNEDNFPLEIIVEGSVPWADNQMQDVPRLQVKNGTFLQGSARIETLRPIGIKDFQLINCRFTGANQEPDISSLDISYLSSDSRCRINYASDYFDKSWKSFARLNFQDDFVQSQQWLDFDLSYSVNTTLKFKLARDWTIGQLVCQAVEEDGFTNEQPLTWYRDKADADILVVNVPEAYLGKTIRIRFQGRRQIEFGNHAYMEGLSLTTPDPWQRLISLTSTSPTISSIATEFHGTSVEPELARKQNPGFAALIQLEPTFQVESKKKIPFRIDYRNTSSYSVIGKLYNEVLDRDLLLQTFEFRLSSSGSSVQQFPVRFNLAAQEKYVWQLNDSDGQPVEFTIEQDTDVENQIWFKLKEPIATTLTLKQQRQIVLNSAAAMANIELPVYFFPEAVNFNTTIYDRTSCDYRLWYPEVQAENISQPIPSTSLAVDQTFSKNASPVSFVYPVAGRAPLINLIRPTANSTEPVLQRTTYKHHADPKRLQSTCVAFVKTGRRPVLTTTLPNRAVLDSVTVNDIPVDTESNKASILIPLQPFVENTIEIRYSTANQVEFLQFAPSDYRLQFSQPPISNSQLVTLADGLTIIGPNVATSLVDQLFYRWLLMTPSENSWSYNRSTKSWHPRDQYVEELCLGNQRNLNSLRWLLALVFLIVGFLFWSSILFIQQTKWPLNAPILFVLGLIVIVSPLAIAQLAAGACWGVLGGHVLGYIRSGTQKRIRLMSADYLLATLNRTVSIVMLLGSGTIMLLVCSQESFAQENKKTENFSTVVIPLDDDQQPGSVVYLDRDTYDRFGNIEKAMSRESRIEIQASRYRLFYSPTKAGFEKLQCEYIISAATGGTTSLPLPNSLSDSVSNVAVDGVPTGYRIQNGELNIKLAASEKLKLSFELQIDTKKNSSFFDFNTLPAADNQLELRGVPTTWMVELYDVKQPILIDRSFSQRNFQLGRIDSVGIRIAADLDKNLEPRIETQIDAGLNRVTCATWFQLGIYRKMTDRVIIETDSRLTLPARYYFATAGFQIEQIEGLKNPNTYEIRFPALDSIPNEFQLEWESELAPIGQLVAPEIRVVHPKIRMQEYVGIKVDRRLLFQPNQTIESFNRLNSKRFPSNDSIPSDDSWDFIFEKRLASNSNVVSLGELRMQPVQATGLLNLRYFIEADRIRWDFDGQIDLSLGELPQLRLAIPRGFVLEDIFLSNDFQNQVLWTRTVENADSLELICFLKQPLTGSLQIRISGSQPNNDLLQTRLFSSQLANLSYKAYLYHGSDLVVETKSDLKPDTSPTDNNLEYLLHEAYSLTPEQAATGIIELDVKPKKATETILAYLDIERNSDGKEILKATYVVESGAQPLQSIELNLPAGFGDLKLNSVAIGDDTISPVPLLDKANDLYRIQWSPASKRTTIDMSFPIESNIAALRLPQFPNATHRYWIKHNENIEANFQIESAAMLLPDEQFLPNSLDRNSKWHPLSSQSPELGLIRKSVDAVDRLLPTVEFQQFNFRTVMDQEQEVLDGLQQWVVHTKSRDHTIKLEVPDGLEVLNAWINRNPTSLIKESENRYAMALDPTNRWHVITIRVLSAQYDTLPILVDVENNSVLYAPVAAATDGSGKYRDALGNITAAVDSELARSAILTLNRSRQIRTQLQLGGLRQAEDLVDNTLTTNEPKTSLETFGQLKTAPRLKDSSYDDLLGTLIAQFSARQLEPINRIEFQTRHPHSTETSMIPRMLISLIGISVVAYLVWRSETHIQLLTLFVGVMAGTYGVVATSTGNWTAGAPLFAFAVLTFAFLAKQRLAFTDSTQG